MPDSIVSSIFLIFVGAALFATLALAARQAIIVAYIVLGAVLGPWGLSWITDSAWIQDISSIGIMFLLYLLGLNLAPQRLREMFAEALEVTLLSAVVFAALGFAIGAAFGFSWESCVVMGAAAMFSSTIIGLKLLPTTTLHHRHTGEVIISVLLLQDLIAIIVLLLLQGFGKGGELWLDILRQLGSLPVLILVAYLLERYLIEPLLARYDQIHEYIFLLVIAWCLGIAELAQSVGLSYEIGAFIAGVALASCPIAQFIAETLKPLRDFFLILFFFSLGAGFNLGVLPDVYLPAVTLAAMILLVKPIVFRRILGFAGEGRRLSTEIGVRLGQGSEFSLLIAVLAVNSGFMDAHTSYVIQMATLITFMVSAYIIVLRYPTPIAVTARLRRD